MRHGRTARSKPYKVPGTSGNVATSDVNQRRTPPHEVMESLHMPAQPTKGVRQTTLFQGVGFIQRPRHLGLWRPSTSKTYTRNPAAPSLALAQFPTSPSRRINAKSLSTAKRPSISGPSPALLRAANCAERSSGEVTERTPPVGSGVGKRQVGQDDTALCVLSLEKPAKQGRVGLSSVGAMEGLVVPDTQDSSKAATLRIGESSDNGGILTASLPVEGMQLDVTEERDICGLRGVDGGCSMESGESSSWGSQPDPDSQDVPSRFRVGIRRRILETPRRAVSVGGWGAAGNGPGVKSKGNALSKSSGARRCQEAGGATTSSTRIGTTSLDDCIDAPDAPRSPCQASVVEGPVPKAAQSLGLSLCTPSGKPSQQRLQKKHQEDSLHPFLRVLGGTGPPSSRADRVCLSPPRRNKGRCATASEQAQGEPTLPAANWLLSRENKHRQGTSQPRMRESTLGIRGFDGGLGRRRKETVASPAVVRKSGSLPIKMTLSRAEGAQRTPDVAANGPLGMVTSTTVAGHMCRPSEADMPGVAASRNDDHSPYTTAFLEGGSKAFETAGSGSSLEPTSSLLARQGVSEGATEEIGGTTGNGKSGLFLSAITARDSSRSDRGKQGGGRSERDSHLGELSVVDEDAATKFTGGIAPPVQRSGSLGRSDKCFVGRGKTNLAGKTGEESSGTEPSGDVVRRHEEVKERVRHRATKGGRVRPVNKIISAHKARPSGGAVNPSMADQGGPTVNTGKRLPRRVPPETATMDENDGKDDYVRRRPTVCSTACPVVSTSASAVKRVTRVLPPTSVSVGCVTSDCAVRSYPSGEPRNATNHTAMRSIVATAERHASAASPRAATPAEYTQSLSGGAGCTQGAGTTPPEVRFARDKQRLYKSGNDGAKRGHGKRGSGFRAGAKRKFSTAPAPAKGAVLGDWRTERRGEGKRAKICKFYISLAGHRLTGTEAYKADKEDKERKSAANGGGVPNRSTIMRNTECVRHLDTPCGPHQGERYLHDDALKLETFGVPVALVESYAKRGVQRLFPWQAHCLRVDNGKPLMGGNLVCSAPTSGGKTLVFELLILRALLRHSNTMVILVVPFIALAMEKRDYLRDVWAPLQLNIQAFHGSEGGDGNLTEGVHVAVCTMEKANSIVNRLAEETRLQALSAVVVDEMHLIGDDQRGFILEPMLSKLRMVCPKIVQLVCLSATLPNIEDIARWLDASLYKTAFRPVQLQHRVCWKRAVFKPTGGGGVGGQGAAKHKLKQVGERIQKVGNTREGWDPDGVVDLVKDALAKDMSVLIFCSTKQWCHTTADLVATELAIDRAHAETCRLRREKSRRVRREKKNHVRSALHSTSVEGHRDGVPRHALPGHGQGAPRQVGKSQRANALDDAARRCRNEEGGGRGDTAAAGFVSASAVVGEGRALSSELGEDEHSRGNSGVAVEELQTIAAERAAERARMDTASAVLEQLRETPVGLDTQLVPLVKAGVAFHHSGLVIEERAILEGAFRQGSIRVLVATSTLAAGVNLPAHRVIIRSPRIGLSNLDSTRYHQMAGRSGRAGVSREQDGGEADGGETAAKVDTAAGESFLLIPKNDKEWTLEAASDLISAPLKKLQSVLRTAKGGGLERGLLEVIVSKIVKSRAGAKRFLSHTLLAAQTEASEVATACDAAIDFLLTNSFIVATQEKLQNEENGVRDPDYAVAPTQLGKATFFSGLSPLEAVDVYRSLDEANGRLITSTELHALYLLTPLEAFPPNWRRFRDEYLGWDEEDPEVKIGRAVGIEEGVLVNMGQHPPKYGERMYESAGGRKVDLLPYRRFYAALVLQQVVEEVPIRNMAARLGIDRGRLQGLQKDASVFVGMVVCFCRHLQWHELANVIFSFQDRLSYSAKPELLPLVRLSRDLPPFRARALVDAGFPTPLALADAHPQRLAELFLRCAPFRSAGVDLQGDSYRAQQARRLANEVKSLAMVEVQRQLRAQLRAKEMEKGEASRVNEAL